jgi:hypothetical protein
VKRNVIVVRLAVDRRAARIILAAVAVGTLALNLSSETLTMTTTYPAPVGVYKNVVTSTLRFKSLASDPDGGAPGAIYFNGSRGALRLYTTGWNDLTGAPQGMFCGYASNPGQGGATSVPCEGADISRGVCPAGFGPVPLGVGLSCLKN